MLPMSDVAALLQQTLTTEAFRNKMKQYSLTYLNQATRFKQHGGFRKLQPCVKLYLYHKNATTRRIPEATTPRSTSGHPGGTPTSRRVRITWPKASMSPSATWRRMGLFSKVVPRRFFSGELAFGEMDKLKFNRWVPGTRMVLHDQVWGFWGFICINWQQNQLVNK